MDASRIVWSGDGSHAEAQRGRECRVVGWLLSLLGDGEFRRLRGEIHSIIIIPPNLQVSKSPSSESNKKLIHSLLCDLCVLCGQTNRGKITLKLLCALSFSAPLRETSPTEVRCGTICFRYLEIGSLGDLEKSDWIRQSTEQIDENNVEDFKL